MRITYQTSDALVIRESAAGLRAFGVIFALAGAIALAAGAGERGAGGGSVAPLAIGVACLVGGALLALLPRTATFAFDKSQRLLIVTRRGVLRRPVREAYALRDIAGVELEQRTDSDGSTTYRVATVLADGTRRPWTGYYSSGRVEKARVVNAARELLELPARVGLAAPAVALSPGQRRAGGYLLVAMAAFLLSFVAFGGRMVWLQHHRLATYHAVPVTVLTAGVEEVSGDDGSSYRPTVTYRYTVAGRTYTSSRVTPLNQSRGRRWASEMAGRFVAGGTYTGYYDPTRPSESFLVRQSTVLPYAFIVIPALMLALLAFAMAANRRSAHG